MNEWNKKIIDEFRAKGGKEVGQFRDRLLLLTTKGARSGQTRTTPVAYTRDGERYVIVASKGGSPTHPSWYHNLLAHGTATVEVGTATIQVRVTVAKGPERDRLYAAHADVLPMFHEYPKKTTRKIPVVILEGAG